MRKRTKSKAARAQTYPQAKPHKVKHSRVHDVAKRNQAVDWADEGALTRSVIVADARALPMAIRTKLTGHVSHRDAYWHGRKHRTGLTTFGKWETASRRRRNTK